MRAGMQAGRQTGMKAVGQEGMLMQAGGPCKRHVPYARKCFRGHSHNKRCVLTQAGVNRAAVNGDMWFLLVCRPCKSGHLPIGIWHVHMGPKVSCQLPFLA